MEFSSTLSVIYTKSCAQTFSPIFGFVAIFNRNFAKLVAPPSNKNENYVVHLKQQSLLKNLKTTSKSAYKQQHNACSNCTPLERTALRPRSVTNKEKKQTPHFGIYSWRALYDLPQTLHGDRARRAHPKRCYPFFDLIHSFSARGKMLIFGY